MNSQPNDKCDSCKEKLDHSDGLFKCDHCKKQLCSVCQSNWDYRFLLCYKCHRVCCFFEREFLEFTLTTCHQKDVKCSCIFY